MPTIEHLFGQGARKVRRPEWGPETFLVLIPAGDGIDPVVELHTDRYTRQERLKFVGGGQHWERVP